MNAVMIAALAKFLRQLSLFLGSLQLHDFLVEDLANWYPEIAGKVKITLVEALPNVLPMFSKQLM